MEDYYELLDLKRDSSEQEIKKAFRKKLKQHHPDKIGKTKESTRMMALLNEAYNTLMDPKKRKDFDDDLEFSRNEAMDDEKIFKPDGYLEPSGTLPFSHVFKTQHEELTEQYRQQPLVEEPVLPHFEPFESKIYHDKDKIHSDIFSFIQTKALRYNASSLKLDQPLTPELSVDLFIYFLKGEVYGENLNKLRQYFSAEAAKIKSVNPYNPEIQLYEGILAILSIDEMTTEQEKNLLFSIKKITDYAKQTYFSTMPFMANLLQNKYFRNLFNQAIHFYWRHSEDALDSKTLQAFNGKESVLDMLNQFKTRLANAPEENAQDLREIIQQFRMLYHFEQDFQGIYEEKHPADFYRKKAFDLLDWLPAFRGKVTQQITINIFIRAGICFQKALRQEQDLAKQGADENLALKMYLIALSIGHHATPDVELYTCTQALKYISLFKFRDTDLPDIIKAFQHRAAVIANIFPFFQPIQNNLDLLMQEERSLVLMRQLLHALVDMIEKNKSGEAKTTIDHNYTTVLYQAYEACLKNWYEREYEEKTEQKIRLDLMQELLAEQKWTFADLDKNVSFPQFVRRDEKGWMLPSRSLPLHQEAAAQEFRTLDGVELNYKTGEIAFSFRRWDNRSPSYEKVLTVDDLDEMLRRNIAGALFSLDPVDPDMPLHPFNQMRFGPASVYETQMFQAMLLTDYLLKFFTTGQEVQGNYPYQVRPLDQLVKHLPAYLKKIIEDFQQAPRYDDSLHRFWIEAESVPVAFAEDKLPQNGIRKIALGRIRMIVKKHKMTRNLEGRLVDTKESGEGWPFYVLTSEQEQALKSKELKISSPAMIFRLGDIDHVCFLENDELSDPVELKGFKEHLTRLYKRKREPSGKIEQNIDNERLIYRLTKEIARQTGKPHRFSAEYIFAQEFTAHYNEFAQYFPEFGRLREFSKITAIVRLIKNFRKLNEDHTEELKKILNDEKHWQERESKIQKVIQEIETKYNADYKKEYSSTKISLTKHFNKWRFDLSMYNLLDKKREKLSELRARAQISLPFSYQRPQLQKQMNKIFSSALPRVSSDRLNNYLIQEFMNGDSGPLASELADEERLTARRQIQKSLFNLPMSEIDSALDGDDAALARIIEKIMQIKFSEYTASKDKEVARIRKIPDNERKDLQDHITGRGKLERNFSSVGLRKQEEKLDLTRTCFWVPANVKHSGVRLVYGGVHVEPNLNILDEGSPIHGAIVNDAFSASEHHLISADSLRHSDDSGSSGESGGGGSSSGGGPSGGDDGGSDKKYNPLIKAFKTAERTPGTDNQFEANLEDGTKVIFRRDIGEHAHDMPNYGYPEDTDHYNIQVFRPKQGSRRGFKEQENLHIVVDENLQPTHIFSKNDPVGVKISKEEPYEQHSPAHDY